MLKTANDLASRRGSRVFSNNDLIFQFRHDTARVERLRTFLTWKAIRKTVKDSDEKEGFVDEADMEEAAPTDEASAAKGKFPTVSLPWDVSSFFSEQVAEAPEDITDITSSEAALEKLRKNDERTRDMTVAEYATWSEYRHASLTYRKAKRFREWCGLGVIAENKPNDDVMDILGFLTSEMVQSLTAEALKVQALELAYLDGQVGAERVQKRQGGLFSEPEGARKPVDSRHQVNLPDGRILSYHLSSQGDEPLVLLANSLSAPFRVWDHVAKFLAENGFRTLRFDQPGHGQSSAPKNLDTTFESIADDVYHLLQSLKNEKVFAWIGVSMGAATSFYFVNKYPGIVHKVAICDTIAASPKNAGVDDLFAPRAQQAREAGNMQEQVEGTIDRWFGQEWVKANPDEADRVRAIMNQTSVDGFATCCHALRSDSFDIRPLFGKVGAGVDEALLVVGDKDANLPEAMKEMRQKVEEGFRAAGKNNKIELKVIKNAGHVPFVDGYDQFKEIILEYLKA
ncbi:hypothetical protein K4K49_011809 [Colletotrichum sp. SAR 10_70]|nr:hypothetical protein K4K50_000610 [Colletotrichum sp. SAR 10_71]KAI8202150.1 hypothetical protein K4K49_011809 [Colletotrichum sp. SAR 10_70]KAI8215131.1 hypothetical protein K4K52_010865 [Colletotrichum sp. SAR 10_76]KAI8260408.1 hypothetical protein K4K53_002052 [Colletotrichum sp. SAR 10_77]